MITGGKNLEGALKMRFQRSKIDKTFFWMISAHTIVYPWEVKIHNPKNNTIIIIIQ